MMRRMNKVEPRTYVALARIKKNDGSFWEPGDEVPEAKTWRNPMSWVMAGKLGPVYDDPQQLVTAPRGDQTRKDVDLAKTIAASDQFEAAKAGEANPPPSENELVCQECGGGPFKNLAGLKTHQRIHE